MTRDPFGHQAIAADRAAYERATTTPNASPVTRTVTENVIPLNRNARTAIAPKGGNAAGRKLAGPGVQSCGPREQYEKYTPAEQEKLLRTLDEPLTIQSVARELELADHRAYRWLKRQTAKRKMVSRSDGHWWVDTDNQGGRAR